MTTTPNRAKKTGRYTYSADCVCACCGAQLATHDAEWPHANADEMRGPECEGFKPLKKR